MFPSTQIIIVCTIFLTMFFYTQVEAAKKINDKNRAIFLKNFAQFFSVLILFFTSISVNHHMSGELGFFEAIRYTISDKTEVFAETVIYTLVLCAFIILLKIQYHSQKIEISKAQITAPIIASAVFMILATGVTSNEQEFDLEYTGDYRYTNIESDDIDFLKDKCPNGIRVEPNFYDYKVTCYKDNLRSLTIKFEYNTSYNDYFSDLSDSEEEILDYTHDLFFYNYDSSKVIVRTINLDKSKRADEYQDAFRELLYYGVRSMMRSVHWSIDK